MPAGGETKVDAVTYPKQRDVEIQELRAEVRDMRSGGLEKKYLAVLEQTNAQLSYGFIPYGVMVGALSALLTAGAVVAAWLLWRQSRDFRADREEEHKEHLRAMERFNMMLDDSERALKRVEAIEPKNSEEVKKLRTEIELLRAQAGIQGSSFIINPRGYTRIYGSKLGYEYLCKQCGTKFQLDTGLIITGRVKCPTCGTEQ